MFQTLSDARERRAYGLGLCDRNYPEASAVLAGLSPGLVFAPLLEKPRACFVFAKGMEGLYLMGKGAEDLELRDELKAVLAQRVIPALKDEGLDCLEISANLCWEPYLPEIVNSPRAERSVQLVWEQGEVGTQPLLGARGAEDVFVPGRSQGKATLTVLGPGNLEDLLHKEDIPEGLLRQKLEQFWPSPESFLKSGVGVVALVGNRIVGLIMSSYVFEELVVVDVEVLADFQGQGLGQDLVLALLQVASTRDLRLHWDCMECNAASVALARKTGFRKIREYGLYELPFS